MPPPLTPFVTSNTRHSTEQAPPAPSEKRWDIAGGRRGAIGPPPVGKAGFEVWVLSKGGLVSVHHCRLYRTVVHVHPLGRYANP